MCQVTPFSLPCCGRIYIHVEKVQGCPDNWPKSKCPPEFCIQISGYEAAQVDQRPSGTCWRCQALAKSKSGRQRENMRPGIDRAHIMPGLEELDARDRRREAEIAGKCWFCGSSAGCTACGPKEAAIVPLESLPDRKPKRQAKEAPAGEKPRKSRRKLKVESQTPTRPLKEESVSSSVQDIIEPQHSFQNMFSTNLTTTSRAAFQIFSNGALLKVSPTIINFGTSMEVPNNSTPLMAFPRIFSSLRTRTWKYNLNLSTTHLDFLTPLAFPYLLAMASPIRRRLIRTWIARSLSNPSWD